MFTEQDKKEIREIDRKILEDFVKNCAVKDEFYERYLELTSR